MTFYTIVLHDQLIMIYMGEQFIINQSMCNWTFETSIDSALNIQRDQKNIQRDQPWTKRDPGLLCE